MIRLFPMWKQQEKEKFTALYRKHHGLVRSVIYRVVGPSHVDDLVQEVFIKVWKGQSKFKGESDIQTWIYRISINVALDHIRKLQKMRKDVQLPDHLAAAESGGDPEKAEVIRRALKDLTPEHRVVIVLFYFEDLSVAEMAEVLTVAEGTIKSRLHYAKEKMKIDFERRGIRL